MGFGSKLSNIGWGLGIWILAVPIFLFTLFPLISCTSKGLSGIYILTYKWNIEANSWVRLGYYGMCWVGGTSGKQGQCYSTSGSKTAKALSQQIFANTDAANVNGIDLGLDLQHNVFVAFMTAGAIDWFISLVLASVCILAANRAGKWLRLAAKFTSTSAAILMIASAWTTNQAVAALEALVKHGADYQDLKVGSLLVGLQWIAAILACFSAWGVVHVADKAEEDPFKDQTYRLGRA